MGVAVTIGEELLDGETDADLVEWHVADGDRVTVGQELAGVETAKVQLAVPSPATGTITLTADVGTVVAPGDVIATIEEAR